jgi:nucleoside-diphosphate-sugar epimerase
MRFKQRRALVTGGLGFIGSNLSRALSQEGADVTVVDACVPGCGANDYNLSGEPSIRVIRGDIGVPEEFRSIIESTDVVFNLAGDVSHIDSMNHPERDMERNTTSQLRFLEACRRWRPGVRIVYAGTRQVYGIPRYLPVDEKHPIDPVDYNGVHKFAATQYHMMLTRMGALDAVVLRLTNVYGPRMSLSAPNQGFLGTFLKYLLKGKPLCVFGDGMQLRDPVYVDDAVEAFLLLGLQKELTDRSFNMGGPEVLSLGEIACSASRTAGMPEPQTVPFPSHLKAIDIGSYYSDSTRLRSSTGWTPKVDVAEGFARALEFYRPRLTHYLPDPLPVPISTTV